MLTGVQRQYKVASIDIMLRKHLALEEEMKLVLESAEGLAVPIPIPPFPLSMAPAGVIMCMQRTIRIEQDLCYQSLHDWQFKLISCSIYNQCQSLRCLARDNAVVLLEKVNSFCLHFCAALQTCKQSQIN